MITIYELRQLLQGLAPICAYNIVTVHVPSALYKLILDEISKIDRYSDEYYYFYEKVENNEIKYIKYRGVSIFQYVDARIINISILNKS